MGGGGLSVGHHHPLALQTGGWPGSQPSIKA